MSELIAVAFNDIHAAEEARLDILKLERKALADFEEAVVLRVEKDGKVRFNHSQHMTIPVALGGGFAGVLVGLLVINPAVSLLGGVVGAAAGAALGATEEIGISQDFMKSLAENLMPGSSALFVVVRSGDPDRIVEALKPYKGHLLRTSLSHENEEKLREALATVSATPSA